MQRDWGRFTACGGEEVEGRISGIVEQVARAAGEVLSPQDYRTLLLIGGYGRGEGGVEVRGGQELPHNNLDFLLISESASPVVQAELKRRIDERLQPLAEEHGLGLDLGTIAASRLRRSPCLVMWYDMRFGHKVVLGDPDFVRSLERFRVDRILPADIRNLLVNRGTLFLINDLLLERGDLTLDERRTVVRHSIKGIIGYGDALLFSLGDYHWSYREKQQRMRERQEVDERIRVLYDQAMEFRFRPTYDAYLDRDLGAWMAELRPWLAEVHLSCERKRLNRPGLNWPDYPSAAFTVGLWEDPWSPRAAARKAVHLLRSPSHPGHASWATHLGFRCSGPRGVLPVLFPVVAYDLAVDDYRRLARNALEARGADPVELRRAYLRQWSVHGDINFPAVLRKLNLSLEPAEEAA